MKIVCLDLEGVLVPEIWIAFSEAVNIPELRRTTRDEPDYDKLMRSRLAILAERGFTLADIQRVISGMEPLPGAVEFAEALRAQTQLIILSDTYEEFARPLMKKLGWPTLFCNSLETGPRGEISGYRLRLQEGKLAAVKALKALNMEVFAAGDSFNDLKMIEAADSGCLFRAPEKIRLENPGIPAVESYAGLLEKIRAFLAV